jgi:23S rRNA pseudouridine1911/1915/1917 synthase
VSLANAWTVPAEAAGQTATAFLRQQTGGSWSEVKRHVATGKVFVGGRRVERDDHRLVAGDRVELRLSAPRPRDPHGEVRIAFEDAHVVVIDKPSGISSVPYEKRESGTAMDLIRDAWRRQGRAATTTPLHIVHRIDKDTSGLLAFAKTKRAERELQAQLRQHTMARSYLCVVQGPVRAGRIESLLVRDRGDGLRGTARHPNQGGKRAVTHVEVLEVLLRATLCRVRLETGKTHQIRIHMAEQFGPIVGERVYTRDLLRRGGEPLEAPRLMLHAATLGFAHPVTGEHVELDAPPPADFDAVLARLRA